jgi:LPXTG-motif cell wall-anchored protein
VWPAALPVRGHWSWAWPPATPPADESNVPLPAGGIGPQAVEGGLAQTGAQLWPSAAGAVLLIAGIALLRVRGRRAVSRHR